MARGRIGNDPVESELQRRVGSFTIFIDLVSLVSNRGRPRRGDHLNVDLRAGRISMAEK